MSNRSLLYSLLILHGLGAISAGSAASHAGFGDGFGWKLIVSYGWLVQGVAIGWFFGPRIEEWLAQRNRS